MDITWTWMKLYINKFDARYTFTGNEALKYFLRNVTFNP